MLKQFNNWQVKKKKNCQVKNKGFGISRTQVYICFTLRELKHAKTKSGVI